MRTCAWCNQPCDAQIGLYRELKTVYWGGKTGHKVTFSPKLVSFFCSDEHRTNYLVEP